MSEIIPFRPTGDITPSVQALLSEFHEDTLEKLALAPLESKATFQRADGSVSAIDENGWPEDYDDLDKLEAIPVQPTSVRDTETSQPPARGERDAAAANAWGLHALVPFVEWAEGTRHVL
ncbi:hypothetical protein ACFQZZ_07995 [Nocardia sp. GCM10030253]|uniref:hypothetical protein n=1 Tax=Nocardia sp. GCM10030253 TaxID=3273404 RepID=UPI00362A70CC